MIAARSFRAFQRRSGADLLGLDRHRGPDDPLGRLLPPKHDPFDFGRRVGLHQDQGERQRDEDSGGDDRKHPPRPGRGRDHAPRGPRAWSLRARFQKSGQLLMQGGEEHQIPPRLLASAEDRLQLVHFGVRQIVLQVAAHEPARPLAIVLSGHGVASRWTHSRRS